MLKTILLPLDGSPLAERALVYATSLARRSEAAILLIAAVQSSDTAWVTGFPDSVVDPTNRAEEYLYDIAGRIGARGIASETHVSDGEPVRAILDAAGRFDADLIVMATHGRGGLGRMLYGSVADQILRRATIPVLLVPSIVEHSWRAEGPLSLLVPLDGSELAVEVLPSADLFVESTGSQLTLLRVVQPATYPLYGEGYAYVPFDEEAEVAAARSYLEAQATRLRERGRSVSIEVGVGDPARVIGEMAHDKDVDMIAMATHGHGGLSRLILGSVATATLRQTIAPLLLVRPSAMHHAEPVSSGPVRMGSTISTEAPQEATAEETDGRTVDVRLRAVDLELIDCGLKALAYAPGYDYGHVLAARALADRLKKSTRADTGEPVAAR